MAGDNDRARCSLPDGVRLPDGTCRRLGGFDGSGVAVPMTAYIPVGSLEASRRIAEFDSMAIEGRNVPSRLAALRLFRCREVVETAIPSDLFRGQSGAGSRKVIVSPDVIGRRDVRRPSRTRTRGSRPRTGLSARVHDKHLRD